MTTSIFSWDKPDNPEGWVQVLKSPSIWHKPNRENKFLKGTPIPYQDGELLEWVISFWGGKLIPSICMFENRNGFSTQCPMHFTYYTDNSELECINGALSHTRVMYTGQHYEIECYQKLILQMKNKFAPNTHYIDLSEEEL